MKNILFIGLLISLFLVGCFSENKDAITQYQKEEGALSNLHIDSLRIFCKSYEDSVSADSSHFFLVNKMKGVPFEILVFDVEGLYCQYIMCSDKGIPKFEMSFDYDLNVIQSSGYPFYLSLTECVKSRFDEIFILPLSPPLFETSLDFYHKYDSTEYVLEREYSVTDDMPLLIHDSTFDASYSARVVIKMEYSGYIHTDTVFYDRILCEEGVIPGVVIRQ